MLVLVLVVLLPMMMIIMITAAIDIVVMLMIGGVDTTPNRPSNRTPEGVRGWDSYFATIPGKIFSALKGILMPLICLQEHIY